MEDCDDNGEPRLDPICELFRVGDPGYRSISILGQIWIPAATTGIALWTTGFHNFSNRRPTFSGIHRFALAGTVGLMIGLYMKQKKLEVLAEKDMQYYHYMKLHPKDFAARERVKFKDFLGPWLPFR